jgi:hypothetical protein
MFVQSFNGLNQIAPFRISDDYLSDRLEDIANRCNEMTELMKELLSKK